MRDSFDELTRVDGQSANARVHATRAPLSDTARGAGQNYLTISDENISDFTDQILTQPEDTVIRRFGEYLEDGHGVSGVFEALLKGCAQDLGARWVADTSSFAEVTLGMALIHRLLRQYGDLLVGAVPVATGSPVVLVSPMPGETHIFAAAYLAEHFRAGGWRIHSGIHATVKTLVNDVKDQHVDVLALTLSSADAVGQASKLISQIKFRSLNTDLRVLVGGPPLVADPNLCRTLGADGTAGDAVSAVQSANDFLAGQR